MTLPARTLEILNNLAVQMNATPQDRQTARILADNLRKKLPDLDDATIARVLVEISGLFALYAFLPESNVATAGSGLALAALDLTALERGET